MPAKRTSPQVESGTNGKNGKVQSLRGHEFSLEMIPLTKLKVDNDPTRGGYARPLSEDRLKKLRRKWDLRKVGTIEVSRRADGSLWLINGQHRREIALEHGIEELPAVVYQGLDRQTEADLYLGFADALPQQALSVFMAKLSMGDRAAQVIKSTVENVGLKIPADYRSSHANDGSVVAINRLERIYAMAGASGLREVLGLVKEAWGLDHRTYQQAMLEAAFQFWAAYHTMYSRERLVERLREAGVEGITSRAYAIRSHGEWPGTVDSLIMAIWRAYHEPKLRGHRLEPWTGRRAKPMVDAEGNVKPFAPGSRAARIDKAREEREQLKLVR